MKLRELLKNLPANLTQSGYLNTSPRAPLADRRERPMVWRRTMRSSLTTEELIMVGTGSMDPTAHTKLIAAYARDRGIPLAEVKEELMDVLATIGYSTSTSRTILAAIGGSESRPFKASASPRIPPTYVLNLVSRHLKVTHDIIHHVITDYVCSLLRDTGWIMADEAYVYRVQRGRVFPRFEDIVDAIDSYDLHRMLMQMSTAKINFVKDYVDNHARMINPSQLAADMTQETLIAHDMARNTYDAFAVAASVLTQLTRVWSTDTPEALRPDARLLRNPRLSDLSENLALFLAAQDMIKNYPQYANHTFPSEEMSSEVIPLFHTAITEHSPFKIEPLSNVVSHIAKTSAFDHQHQPVATIIHEAWNYNAAMTAFTTVKHAGGNSDGRFLLNEQNVSSALMAAIKPIHDHLNVERMVEHRLATVDIQYASKRMPTSGPSIFLALASEMYGQPVISDDVESPTLPAKRGSVSASRYYDVLALMTHLAVVHCSEVSVVTLSGAGLSKEPQPAPKGKAEAANPSGFLQALVFTQRTPLITPLGDAAINRGEVSTIEPLEVLMYVPDFSHGSALEAKSIDLDDPKIRRAVHVWRIREHSTALAYSQKYTTHIRNKQVVIEIDEAEAFALGVARRSVRFFNPTLARANTKRWVQWMRDEIADLQAYAAGNTKDPLIAVTVEGRHQQIALEAALSLARIGSSGIGANIVRVIQHKVTEQLYGAGMIDDASALHVGVEHHRMMMFAGLTSMAMLTLLDQEDIDWLQKLIDDKNAVAMVVATNMA